jgi:Short repeat of unknown function (DUF308)
MATVASVLVVGIMMIVAGVAEVINAFQIKSWGKFLFWALLGVLYIVAGFVTFDNPLFAAVLLTLLLGASLVASGIMRIFLAFSMKTGNTVAVDRSVRRHHSAARLAHPRAMANQQHLCSRLISRHRPDHSGCRLARRRLRIAPQSGSAGGLTIGWCVTDLSRVLDV